MNKVFYQCGGSGTALVLLHGWGFDHQIWNNIRPDLETHFTVYCPDLPGHGRTPPMSAKEFFYTLQTFLPTSYTLLGWSLGGVYAMKFACLYPQKVMKLINVATSPYFLLEEGWPGIHTSVFTRFYQRYLRNPKQTIKEFIQVQTQHSVTNINIDFPEMGIDLESGLSVLREWDLRKELAELNRPVYFLLGKRDSIVPAGLADTLSKQYPDFYVKLWPRAAHMPFLSHQKEFINYIREVAL